MDLKDAAAEARKYAATRSRHTSAADALRSLIDQLVSGTIEVDHITGRAKDASSVEEKLARRDDYTGLESLDDLVGLRIVTRYASDVAKVCDLLSSELEVVEDVTHGGNAPDAFGYSSRHLICMLKAPRCSLPEWIEFASLRFEIQIRSILQHAWASISHGLDYKTGAEVPGGVRRQLFRVAALLETGDELFDGFRTAVSGVRVGYAEHVASSNWRDLALDLDSLSAAADELPLESVSEAAAAAGWKRLSNPYAQESMQNSYRQLLKFAERAGLTTLGELSDFAATIVLEPAILSRIADKCPVFKKPVVIAPDILAMALLARASLSDKDIEECTFRPELKEALRSIRDTAST